VTCSYLQIYNDKLFDLLADRKNKRPLALREQERSHKREVFVAGLSEYRWVYVESLSDRGGESWSGRC
jgi:hypothetical protein